MSVATRSWWSAFLDAFTGQVPRHEVTCPRCDATIRARMADRVDDPKHRYEAYWRDWNDRELALRAGVPNPTGTGRVRMMTDALHRGRLPRRVAGGGATRLATRDVDLHQSPRGRHTQGREAR